MLLLEPYLGGIYPQQPFGEGPSVYAIFTNLFLLNGMNLNVRGTWNNPNRNISVEFFTYLIFGVPRATALKRRALGQRPDRRVLPRAPCTRFRSWHLMLFGRLQRVAVKSPQQDENHWRNGPVGIGPAAEHANHERQQDHQRQSGRLAALQAQGRHAIRQNAPEQHEHD